MSFTIENEKQNRMSFFDAQIICEDNIYTTFVCRKPTFSEVYTQSDSVLPSISFVLLFGTLTHRCFRICSSWTKLHTELVCLK